MANTYSADYQRLEELIKFFGLPTEVALAKEIGLRSAQTIYNIRKLPGSYHITSRLAKLICTRWPQVNYEWVMTGEGEMVKSVPVPGTAQSEFVTIERTVLETIISQQETIRMLTETVQSMTLKKDLVAQLGEDAGCADAKGA